MRIRFSSIPRLLPWAAPCSALFAGTLVAGTLSLVSCGKGSAPPSGNVANSASASASSSSAPLDPTAAFIADRAAPLTADVCTKLLEQLSTCKVTERGIESTCNAYRDFGSIRTRSVVSAETTKIKEKVGQAHLTDPSAAVRWQAVKLFQGAVSANPENVALLLAAAKQEKEPAVLVAMQESLAPHQKQNEEIKQLLLSNADNPSEYVRKETLRLFLTRHAEGVPGTFDKVLERMEKDPAIEVRSELCRNLYGSSDPRAIPMLQKVLEATTPDPALYSRCWSGLINSWAGILKPNVPSQKGYELTLKLLEKKPRSITNPPPGAVTALLSARLTPAPTDNAGVEWAAKVKPWYKQERIMAVLKDLSTDGKANWMSRTGAVRVLKALGEGKATFELLVKKYASAKEGSDDFHVKRQAENSLRDLESRAAGVASGIPSGELPLPLRGVPPGAMPRIMSAPPPSVRPEAQ